VKNVQVVIKQTVGMGFNVSQLVAQTDVYPVVTGVIDDLCAEVCPSFKCHKQWVLMAAVLYKCGLTYNGDQSKPFQPRMLRPITTGSFSPFHAPMLTLEEYVSKAPQRTDRWSALICLTAEQSLHLTPEGLQASIKNKCIMNKTPDADRDVKVAKLAQAPNMVCSNAVINMVPFCRFYQNKMLTMAANRESDKDENVDVKHLHVSFPRCFVPNAKVTYNGCDIRLASGGQWFTFELTDSLYVLQQSAMLIDLGKKVEQNLGDRIMMLWCAVGNAPVEMADQDKTENLLF
jgi:hypothetical protein